MHLINRTSPLDRIISANAMTLNVVQAQDDFQRVRRARLAELDRHAQLIDRQYLDTVIQRRHERLTCAEQELAAFNTRFKIPNGVR
jgi:hypothetical protein